MAEGESFPFYTGVWGGHGLYVNFTRDSKTGLIHRRVDNLGQSSENHVCDEGKILPCQLFPLNESQLVNYIENIYKARTTGYSRFEFWKDNYSLISDGSCGKPNAFAQARDPQSAEDCVVKNTNVGEEIRAGYYIYQ